jgi:predicted MPP superfamily phosphohydrolase
MRQNTKVKYLPDEVALVDQSFSVVGRDDKRNRSRSAIEQLVENLNRTKPVILVDHYPTDMREAQRSGITLAFSGHTHRHQFYCDHSDRAVRVRDLLRIKKARELAILRLVGVGTVGTAVPLWIEFGKNRIDATGR